MSVNLVSLVSQYLTPDLIKRMAAALGVDQSLVGRAATALAPAILGSLSHVASTPDGARKLASTISQQSPSILGTLESAIGGAGQQTLAKEGIGTLGSLLGGSAVSALAGAVGRFTGIGQGVASSLIGMLAPAVLGILGKHRAAQGLDASGLAQLLAAQKENISAALPSGFGELLRAAGVPGFEGVAAEAPKVTRSAVAPAPSESAPWSLSRLGWILGLGALALLAWWYFGNRPAGVVEKAKTPEGQVVQNLSVDGVDLRSSVQTTLDGLKTTLQGVSDPASAQAALPQLEKDVTEFDKLRELSTKLPVDGKSALAALVTTARPAIEELFNKVLTIPGVAAIAKPTIDGLRVKLDALSKA
jgi:hypothetical protein